MDRYGYFISHQGIRSLCTALESTTGCPTICSLKQREYYIMPLLAMLLRPTFSYFLKCMVRCKRNTPPQNLFYQTFPSPQNRRYKTEGRNSCNDPQTRRTMRQTCSAQAHIRRWFTLARTANYTSSRNTDASVHNYSPFPLHHCTNWHPALLDLPSRLMHCTSPESSSTNPPTDISPEPSEPRHDEQSQNVLFTTYSLQWAS
jgi:hypothetical protein